jgi:hypothetical protein
MTQLTALTLTRTQLDQIPADERLFYFMAGQLHNDISILGKLLNAAANELKLVDSEPPKQRAALAQALLLLKLTAGRLYEGHHMINKTFSAKGFLKKYKAEMSSAHLASLDTLNKYFGGGSTIQRIRHRFAFHLDAASIATAYANMPAEFTSVEYLSKEDRHNLFYTSEMVGLIAMFWDGADRWRDTIDQTVEPAIRSEPSSGGSSGSSSASISVLRLNAWKRPKSRSPTIRRSTTYGCPFSACTAAIESLIRAWVGHSTR